MEQELIIQADEVAIISRDPDGKYHVDTSHSGCSTAGGAIWGGFWGVLFGMLFLNPFAGWATGAGLGALSGHLRDKSIDETFQQQVRDQLQPGTSALFMMIQHATPDRAIAALEQYGGTVIKTWLADEDTRRLQIGVRVPASPLPAARSDAPRPPNIAGARHGQPTNRTGPIRGLGSPFLAEAEDSA